MPSDPLAADERPIEPSSELQVLVAGSGVGGLALAGFLRQRGLTPVVVDSRGDRAVEPDGAVLLSSRARSRVAELGLDDALAERAVPVEAWVRRTEAGETIRDTCDAGGPVAVDRETLLATLSRVVPDGLCRADAGVEALDVRRDVLEVTFDDGVRERFDVVVGADADSAVRTAVADAGRTSATARTWCVSLDAGDRSDAVVDCWGERGVLTRLPGADGDWCRLTRVVDGEAARSDGFEEAAAAAGLAAHVPDCVGDDGTTARDVRRFESTLWASGRAAFVGGAARTVHPAVGADASVALADARALAEVLTRGRDDVQRRTARYARRRTDGRTVALDGTDGSAGIDELRAARLRWLRRIDRADDDRR